MPCGSPAPLCRAAAHWSSNGGNHRPTTATNDTVFDFQALLHPGTVFEHPREVVTHPSLTMSEKRAILDSWASDASAIASCPALRAPQGLKRPSVSMPSSKRYANWTAARALRPAARQTAASPRREPWRHEKGDRPMEEDIRGPRHVIDRLDHRRAGRLEQDAKVWSSDRSRLIYSRHVDQY